MVRLRGDWTHVDDGGFGVGYFCEVQSDAWRVIMRSIEHWPQTERVWRQFARLDIVLERLEIDPVLAARKSGGTAMAKARDVCLACIVQRQCSQRLEGEQASAILEFCPNAEFLKDCVPR
jgi:hypothetical protein